MNFKKPQYNSQVVIGDTLKPKHKPSVSLITNNLKNEEIIKESAIKIKSRNLGKSEFRANNTMINNTQFVEVFGSINKNIIEERNARNSKFSNTLIKNWNFKDLSRSVNKNNFFEGSADNPLRTTCTIDEEKKYGSMKILLTTEDEYTSFHVFNYLSLE